MAETMIERAVAAIKPLIERAQPIGEYDPSEMARAVLAAMREPTQAMEDAGYGNSKGDPDHTGYVDNPDPVEAYIAMIDAALSEKG